MIVQKNTTNIITINILIPICKEAGEDSDSTGSASSRYSSVSASQSRERDGHAYGSTTCLGFDG